MIGIVGGQADKLIVDGHGAAIVSDGGAGYYFLQQIMIVGESGGVLCAGEKAFAQSIPRLGGIGWKAFGSMSRDGRWFAFYPVEADVLPVGHVPDFVVDGMSCGGLFLLRRGFRDGLQDAGWRGESAGADEGFGEFVHGGIVTASYGFGRLFAAIGL